MSVGVRLLACCINESINTFDVANKDATLIGLQLAGAVNDFETGFVYSVPCLASLPTACLNTGRMVYIEDIGEYRYSTGVEWSNNFSSELSNFSAWTWGANNTGQLGDISTISSNSPVSVMGSFIDWCQVSAGDCHSLGLKTDGTIWAWGFNTTGQLGDNTTSNRSSPVLVAGGFTDWCYISSGKFHNVALTQTGVAWAWGCNSFGRLGDNTLADSSSPVSVAGVSNWFRVSSGGSHNLGLRVTDTVWSWGFNGNGELGDGTTDSKSSPVSIIGGFTDWCAISAGGNHSLAIRFNGTAWAWGLNSSGQLGDGTTTNQSSPVSVIGGFTDWCQMGSGCIHSLGIRSNGTLWSWGENISSQLGNGSAISSSSPVSVIGGFTNWCQASAGFNHSLAVRTDGSIWTWGSNLCNQLGLGVSDSINRSSPVSITGNLTNWCQVAAGSNHNIALKSSTGFI